MTAREAFRLLVKGRVALESFGGLVCLSSPFFAACFPVETFAKKVIHEFAYTLLLLSQEAVS